MTAAPQIIIRETPDEAIRMMQRAVIQYGFGREETTKLHAYLEDYATVEAARRDADVSPDIADRLYALGEEWRSH